MFQVFWMPALKFTSLLRILSSLWFDYNRTESCYYSAVTVVTLLFLCVLISADLQKIQNFITTAVQSTGAISTPHIN